MQSSYLAMIQAGTVTMISKTYCPFCVQAKQMLNNMGVKFQVLEVDKLGSKYTPSDKQSMDKLAGVSTYPKTFVGTQAIGGCDDLKAAISNGSLKTLLTKEGIAFK